VDRERFFEAGRKDAGSVFEIDAATKGLTISRSSMSRTNLFFKVEIEHDPEDSPERIGEEIVRKLIKLYGVRDAELASYATVEE
jgi:hypothetical protein